LCLAWEAKSEKIVFFGFGQRRAPFITLFFKLGFPLRFLHSSLFSGVLFLPSFPAFSSSSRDDPFSDLRVEVAKACSFLQDFFFVCALRLLSSAYRVLSGAWIYDLSFCLTNCSLFMNGDHLQSPPVGFFSADCSAIDEPGGNPPPHHVPRPEIAFAPFNVSPSSRLTYQV